MANPRTIARLESRIRERAAYCLQFEVKDPRASFVTITKVVLSKDLEHGKVYWSHFGTAAEKRRAEEMLTHASGFIQRQVARVLQTRTVPRLRWIYDESLEHAADLDLLIREARRRDAEIRGDSGADLEGPADPAGEVETDDPDPEDEEFDEGGDEETEER